MTSDCHSSLGAAASKRCHELRGRLRGSGTTRPAAWRMRRIVEVEGARRPSRSRCQAIVTGPASRPCARELGAQGDDALAHRLRCPAGVAAWSAGARLDRLEAALAVAAQEAVQMLAAEAVLGRGGGDGQLVRDDLEDGDPVLRHATDCRPCPDSPVAYHLSPMS